ncbi:MAG TPA: hypothetical protein VFI03_13760 [Solirubrobacterales bacterium]|nr:hypothetical protein [Solirubrobacterales bacterium]
MRETKASERDENAAAPIMALQTFGPDGQRPQTLLSGALEEGGRRVPVPFEGPNWSGDGALLAFAGSAGRSRRIYLVAADGSGLRVVPGTRNATSPILSPDGRTLAFSRSRYKVHFNIRHPERSREYSATTAWVVDLAGGKPRPLTRWRNGLHNEPSSFSPDGSTLALTKQDDNLDGPRVVLAPVDGSAATELVQLAEEAAISPDGSRLAFIGYKDLDVVQAEEDRDYTAGELYAMNIDGTGLRRLTRSDDILESAPSWDPSGQRLAYVQFRADTSFVPGLGLLFPVGNSVMQINPDGSCRRKLLSLEKVAFYGVAWQSGPGREAGPIAC